MQIAELPKRKLHETDFRGKPFWMRVPTVGECIQAQLAAARYIKDETGPDEPVDPELWTVDTATAFVLAKSCVDKDGGEQMTGSMMLRHHSQDEMVELLNKLNAFRETESKSPALVDDDEVEMLAETLAGCETELDAYQVCAAVRRDALVRGLFGMSRLLAKALAKDEPSEAVATS